MLLQIRKYITRERIVSTDQLRREFHLELSALEPMLDFWVHKGVISKSEQAPHCRSACFKCRTPPVYYQVI